MRSGLDFLVFCIIKTYLLPFLLKNKIKNAFFVKFDFLIFRAEISGNFRTLKNWKFKNFSKVLTRPLIAKKTKKKDNQFKMLCQ